MERFGSAYDAGRYGAGLQGVLRAQYGALRHLCVLRKPAVQLFQRGDQRRYDRASGKRQDIFKSKRSKVYVRAFQKRFLNDKFPYKSVRAFYFLLI